MQGKLQHGLRKQNLFLCKHSKVRPKGLTQVEVEKLGNFDQNDSTVEENEEDKKSAQLVSNCAPAPLLPNKPMSE